MRTGHYHQGPVERIVLRQRDRNANRAHPRHPVLDVPSLEVGMPVELLSHESRLEIGSRLVDVDLTAKDLASDIEQANISGQPLEDGAEPVNAEDRPHRAAARFRYHLCLIPEMLVARQRSQFVRQLAHLRGTDEMLHKQVAMLLEVLQVLGRQPASWSAPVNDWVNAGVELRLARETRGIDVLDRCC